MLRTSFTNQHEKRRFSENLCNSWQRIEQFSRIMYRKIFQFDGVWRGRRYMIKQVAPVVAKEPDRLVVVTVYAFYF
jgi:hypothetical protein